MTEHLSRIERTIRMVVSVFALIIGFLNGSLLILLIGLIILATALMSWCPVHGLFRMIESKNKS